ncbi:hypothetical protein V6Z11_A02G081800 [Gossypium hirsutum]
MEMEEMSWVFVNEKIVWLFELKLKESGERHESEMWKFLFVFKKTAKTRPIVASTPRPKWLADAKLFHRESPRFNRAQSTRIF